MESENEVAVVSELAGTLQLLDIAYKESAIPVILAATEYKY